MDRVGKPGHDRLGDDFTYAVNFCQFLNGSPTQAWQRVEMVGQVNSRLGTDVADAQSKQKPRQRRLTFFGDGASSTGDVHESLNLASLLSLPVIFVIENNGYAYSTPVSE